ncbi:MAG: hypothetical protein ACRC7N_12920 [Clostridium sp.]
MKTYTKRKADGSIEVTHFDKRKSYTKKYASLNEYKKESSADAFLLCKIMLAPIYYPIKLIYKIMYTILKITYWDLPRYIYSKLKK